MICCHPYSADATLHFSFSCATQSMASTATFQKLKLKRHTMDRIDGIQFFPSPIVIDGRSSCKLRKQDLWQPILASSSCNINLERVLKAQCDSATAIMFFFFFLLTMSCLLPTCFSSPHTPVVDPHPHLSSIASVAVQTVERLLSLLGHDGSSTNDPLSPTVVIDRPPRRTNYWCPTLGCYHAPRPGWLELLAAHPRLCSGINPEPII